jgi:hypothetical protein
MFEKYVDLVDRPPAPRSRGTLRKNLALKSPVYGGYRGRFREVIPNFRAVPSATLDRSG